MNDRENGSVDSNYCKFTKLSIDALKAIEKNIQEDSMVLIDYNLRTKIEDAISFYYEKIKK